MDGLLELMISAMWILWGAALLIGETLPKNRPWSAYWLVTPAILCVSGFATIWATKRLKARLTFPRTGYVGWVDPRGFRSESHRHSSARQMVCS